MKRWRLSLSFLALALLLIAILEFGPSTANKTDHNISPTPELPPRIDATVNLTDVETEFLEATKVSVAIEADSDNLVQGPEATLQQFRLPNGEIAQATISGLLPLNSDEIPELRLISTSESSPLSDSRWDTEPRDPQWAGPMESVIYSVSSTIDQHAIVECRTTVCRATITYDDDVKLMEPEVRRPRIQNDIRLLSESFGSLISSPGSRLNTLSVSSLGSTVPDGPFQIVFSLSGLPTPVAASGETPDMRPEVTSGGRNSTQN